MIESIAAVVTAVGVVFAGLQLRAAQVQRVREFESLYVQRYWKIVDGLPLGELDSGTPYEQLSEKDRKSVEMYVLLCEDQYEMRKEGAISRSTFAIWRQGIDNVREREPFLGAAAQIQARRNTTLTLLRTNAAHDPFDGRRVSGWVRGVG
ncbi:hypothetical protein [Pseudonocardia spirodelae]|uniref:Uncharacterized protein n=1 Tax=Pseudonocardia spirodelae TaxID=3133431 RepID=A0ABU8T639_9PSEU